MKATTKAYQRWRELRAKLAAPKGGAAELEAVAMYCSRALRRAAFAGALEELLVEPDTTPARRAIALRSACRLWPGDVEIDGDGMRRVVFSATRDAYRAGVAVAVLRVNAATVVWEWAVWPLKRPPARGALEAAALVEELLVSFDDVWPDETQEELEDHG